MTAQILAAELGNLIQDSKRKNNELRAAAEKSLQDLKSLPQTSEAQLAADISRRPHFISPFLIACATHNAKFASTGVSCLQRLGVSRALPKERLNEVLEALKESTTSSHDVQLKILQALPALLQHYPVELRGDQLSTTLQICSGLQNAKNAAVSNTAAATLQQLVITVFDRVAAEDERALEVPIVTEVKGDDGLVPVRPAANDAYKTFNDLVLLVVGEKPLYMRISAVPPALLLELIEAILSNHAEVMTTHVEQNHLLRTLLMPLIIRSLSDRLSFPVTVRIIRILNLIIRNQLEILPSECEIALGLLNHMLDPEASQLWKRALCLEVFRGIYADSRLLLTIYTLFDATEGKKSIFGDNLAAFVRLAIEKPALIGLGQQSTAPAHLDDKVSSESAVAEAGAIAGVIGGPVMESNNTSRPFGISAQWSSMRTPCIEHLDKSDPPALPDTYVYGLVLTCITNISESLAKFVLPLTVHHEGRVRKKKGDEAVEADADTSSSGPDGHRLSRTQSFRKRTIPVNPLDLTDHTAYPFVLTSSTLVTECWPAVLATCSTFLNAALDTDYYRALIRAIQKFTQVSGLLRLSTPRDAFLTTLGKVAIPSNLLMANVSSPKAQSTESTRLYSNAKGLLSVDSLVSQATSLSGEGNRRPSHDASIPSLGPRNLLCLRALLNLAIALGPTLQSAWSIIFETLQVADLVMALSARNVPRSAGGAGGDSAEKLESETSAVQAAARRLFESTVDYPNESFTEMLQALCALIGSSASSGHDTPKPASSGRPQVLHQRRMGSVSGISVNTETNSRDSAFALNKLGELASLNENRLAQFDPAESGWDVLVETLIRYSTANTNATSNRLLAADILSRTAKEVAEYSISDEQRVDIQARVLAALQKQISELYQQRHEVEEDSHNDAEVKVHQIALDALKSVIEHCGETLVSGWGAVLDSLMSVFLRKTSTVPGAAKISRNEDGIISEHDSPTEVKVISRALARSAFATAHLVCSDFLAALPTTCLRTLLDLLLNFSCQHDDLNMSLTAVTYFWNVADFLQSQGDLSGLPDLVGNVKHQHELGKVLASQNEVSVHVLWLQVLLDLSLITTDRRTEVRHSAIQTIGRVFESYDDQLSPEAWMICLHVILFGMIESNIASQRKVRQARVAKEDISSWDQTTKAVLQTVSSLMTMYTERLTSSQRGNAWSALLQQLQNYFHCGSHALGTSVFDTITGVLSHTEDANSLGMSPLLQTANIWNAYLDDDKEWNQESDGNQAAFVAYVDAFKALYQLAVHSLDEQLPSMLSKLELCIVKSDVVAYSSDVDNMTALQSRVMECLSLIQTQGTSLPSIMIQVLGRFCVLPYTTAASSQQDKRGPTFVALAKSSMTLLQDIIPKHSEERDIYTSGALLSALHSLSKPIQEKYIWQREGKSPSLWQKASTTTIAVLKSTLSHLHTQLESPELLLKSWGVIIDIAFYITRAQLPTSDLPAALTQHEKFDIEHYIQLRDLITELLGSTTLPDSLRRTYTRNLFTTSLIHTPLPGELPDLGSAPLEDLYKIRYGQTAKLEVIPRVEMSYTCLTELIRLVAVHDSSTPGVKLAQAAAPYFILRMALPLKTYIADHPLRGRMPAPELEREELLHVLVELEKLETDPQSIPNAPGVSSEHRKHLHRLYPLFIKAIRVARQDEKVGDALGRLVELVGEEFGIDD